MEATSVGCFFPAAADTGSESNGYRDHIWVESQGEPESTLFFTIPGGPSR